MSYEALNVLAAWAGVILALASLVWNIYNTWEIQKQEKVHLQLRHGVTNLPDSDVKLLTWNITNLSHFSVDIEEIGFSSKRPAIRRRGHQLSKVPVLSPILTRAPAHFKLQGPETASFPMRLDRRDSITLAAPHHNELRIAQMKGYHHIYVATLCGYLSVVNIETLDDILKRRC